MIEEIRQGFSYMWSLITDLPIWALVLIIIFCVLLIILIHIKFIGD